jgi:hypothetical protein
MLSAVTPEVYPVLERFGILDAVGRENVFERTADAIASCPPPRHHFPLRPAPHAFATDAAGN